MRISLHLIMYVLLFFTFRKAEAISDSSKLNLKRIFTDSEFNSKSYKSTKWLKESDKYTYLEKSKEVKGGFEIFVYDIKKNKSNILVSATKLIPKGQNAALPIYNYSWSEDAKRLLIFTNTKKVWRDNTRGDYWVLNLKTDSLHKLGGKDAKASTLMFAKFSPDGKKLAYVRENNIYVENLVTNKIKALTTDGTKEIINGTFDWAYEEELHIQDGFRWSPDSKNIAFWQVDASGIRNFLMIDNTSSNYSKTIPVQYPKVGEQISGAKIGIVNIDTRITKWMKIEGNPRDNYLARMEWRPDGKSVIIQQINRNQNHLKLILADKNTGNTKLVFEEKSKSWINIGEDFQWLDNDRYLWVSEREDFRKVYVGNVKNPKQNLITPFAMDIISIKKVDKKNGWMYFIASPENPTQRYLFRSKLNGKSKANKLTPIKDSGTHNYNISPTARFAIHYSSTISTPWETDLVNLPKHQLIKSLEDNKALKQKLAKLDISKPEFFRMDIGDVVLDGWMIKPSNFDNTKKYPVLFYVYGEPWNQTVLDKWGYSNYLWHQYLAQEGYIVISIDNRGTPAPRGTEFRKSIYGQVGVLASSDQAKAAEKVAKWDFIDEERIGIWGWSGGGAMTLNAMFRFPEIYKLGMSVAPVTDQRLYDAIYQERYMGPLSENEEQYIFASPISQVQNLKGKLLLVHGTGDDNVHYQNSEALINELIKYNKIFSFMSYPNRSHSIREGENTSRHLRETLTNYLKSNMDSGARDKNKSAQ